MTRTLLLLTMLMLFSASIFAQSKTVTGKVTEANGNPLAGATISAKGKPIGATNASGNFSVLVSADTRSIEISSIGYGTREITLTGQPLTVALTAGEANSITEVVVTGYTNIQRKKFAGAIATVSAAEVRKQTFGSFDQALQGQAAGVSVVANSGQPGANAIVRIRGNGSISGGNVPLYIMDGIEITAADFSTINQGDFERVEILKDAVATAMYGSRGANGVLVITTRKGRIGGIQLNYDAQVGFSKLPEDKLIVMNSQQKIDYELQRGNPYGWTTAEADSLRKVNFSWKDALFKTGITQQHQLSASGGTAQSRFYASIAYMKQEGILKTTGLDRYTARINVDNTIKNWKFGLNLQGGFSKVVGTGEANTFLSSPLNAIRWGNPYERDYDPVTGDFNESGGAGTGSLYSGQPNPAMELFLNSNNNDQIKGVAVGYLQFDFPFLKGLSARTNWGIDYTQNETSNFTSPRTSVGIARQGILTRGLNRNARYTGTTSLNYKQQFGKHEVEGGIFGEVIKNNFRSFGFTGYGFTTAFSNEAGITPGSASNPNYIPTVNGNGTKNGLYSIFTILNYGYDSKYYVSLVGRRDGSSRFGVNNRFANFGSVGLTWALMQEDFMRKQNAFQDLRIRASIGTTGNNNTQAGDFPIPIFAKTSYAGTNGFSAGTAGNLDYRWETNRTINFGLDFAVLNRRLSGSVDLYDRKTKDLFFAVPIDPALSGFTNIPSNFGSLRNRGFELALRGDVIRNKSFRWTIEGNLTYNQNRVLELPADSTVNGLTILAKGQPINSLYVVRYAGVDPATGNSLYLKRDGTTTPTYSINDKVINGTSDAPWFGGLSTSLDYKGFDLSAQVTFFLDKIIFNNDRTNVINPSYFFDNMSVDVLREWKKAGDITDVPRPSSSGGNAFQASTTRFVEDGSFWRLRNVTLGYTVPASALSKLKIRAARIFVQGENLWKATKFLGFDPEFAGTSLTGAQYPALVQGTVGLSIGF
jgi:TonB-linked SusC/RagA family outer membrane protein